MSTRTRRPAAKKAAPAKKQPQKQDAKAPQKPEQPPQEQGPQQSSNRGVGGYGLSGWTGMDEPAARPPTKSAQLIADRELARQKGK